MSEELYLPGIYVLLDDPFDGSAVVDPHHVWEVQLDEEVTASRGGKPTERAWHIVLRVGPTGRKHRSKGFRDRAQAVKAMGELLRELCEARSRSR